MNLIASMTTYPARFEYAEVAILCISNQTKKPDALVINISEEDWAKANLEFIHKVKDRFGDWAIFNKCVNLKPANKIIPTAEKYMDSIIVTFDDDVRYPDNRVEKLFKKHLEYPDNPISFRTRKVLFDGKKTKPYSFWKLSKEFSGPNKLNFSTAVSGNLYPPNFFSKKFFDKEKYIKLSHTADDIWTYFHVLLEGSSFVRAGSEPIPPSIHGSQQTALWKHNVSKGNNDIIINNLEKEYGSIYNLAVKNDQGN